MSHVDKTTCEVSGVGSLHSRISKTLTGTVRSDKVLLHRHTLLQVRKNRVLNDGVALGTSLLRLGHQTTHTSKLGNLIGRSTGTRVKHHVHSVEALVGLGHVLHHSLLQVGVDVCPSIDHLVVTLLIGDKTHIEVGGNVVDLILTLLHNGLLVVRNDDIVEVKRQTSEVCHAITQVLDAIEEGAGASHTHRLNYDGNEVTQRLLRNDAIEETNL